MTCHLPERTRTSAHIDGGQGQWDTTFDHEAATIDRILRHGRARASVAVAALLILAACGSDTPESQSAATEATTSDAVSETTQAEVVENTEPTDPTDAPVATDVPDDSDGASSGEPASIGRQVFPTWTTSSGET
ncbi:MAG TPA: hypothetical protein VLN74_16355, partial [Ilumatobacteraceae bacterium]|nr:hypothetical protein [Ilumatobacteraceae bacterium]